MKRIEAIIPQKKLSAINDMLSKIGVTGLTVFESKGRGKEPRNPTYGGSSGLFFPEFNNSHTIMILVSDSSVQKVVESIKKTAVAGKIIISNIENVIDIKENKEGEQGL